jgi:hypothetical protein
MQAFWNDWGKPPPAWRDRLRTAKPKRQAATPRPAKPNPKPVVLTPEDIEFGIKTGMLKP